MKNYIVINGKKAGLTEEQLKKLGIEIKENNIFERGKDNTYYMIDTTGDVLVYTERKNILNDMCYKIANYCRDRKIMEQRALHETLNRLLWRFSMQNGGDEIDWHNNIQAKWGVYYDHSNNRFEFFIDYTCKYHEQYFVSEEIAQRAIDEIIKPFMEEHPEFVW